MMIYKNNPAVHSKASGTNDFHKNFNFNKQLTDLKSQYSITLDLSSSLKTASIV